MSIQPAVKSNVIPLRPISVTNIDTALQLAQAYQELFNSDNPENVAAKLFSAFVELILMIKNSVTGQIPEQMEELLVDFFVLHDMLQKPPFNTPTFAGLEQIKNLALNATQLEQNLLLAKKEYQSLEQQLQLEREKNNVLEEQLSQVDLSYEQAVQKVMHAINSPTGKFQLVFSQLKNQLRTIEQTLPGLTNSQNSLNNQLHEFEQAIGGFTPPRARVISSDSSLPMEDLENELEILREYWKNLDDEIKNKEAEMAYIEEQLIPMAESLHAKGRFSAKSRIQKLKLMKQQLQSYVKKLVKLEEPAAKRLNQLTNTLQLLKQIMSESLDSLELAEIPAFSFDKAALQIVHQPQSTSAEPAQCPLNIPEEVLLKAGAIQWIGQNIQLTFQEVFICTLYEILQKDISYMHRSRYSLRKVLWAAGRAGLIPNQPAAIHGWMKSWGGKREIVYANHKNVMPFLEYKPMQTPAFLRSATKLPWSPADVFEDAHIKAIKEEFRKKIDDNS